MVIRDNGAFLDDSRYSFLSGGGEAAVLIAGLDWASTSLGPLETWPPTLKIACSIILRSPAPYAILWGEDGVMIYNDAYFTIAGGRHPAALGCKVREGWPEVADFNDMVMRTVLSGQFLSYHDQEFTFYRNGGVAEQAWLTLDYSPVPDETGRPAGVLASVIETTEKIRAEQRLRGESERLRRMFEQAPGFVATLAGPDHIFETANNAYLQLVGNRQIIGKSVRDALPEVAEQGFIGLLDEVLATRQPFFGNGERVLLTTPGRHEPDERFLDFIYQPVYDEDGEPTGILVQGHDVTDQRLAENALRESEHRFRLVAENAPVMLWMVDETGRCNYLNTALRDFWGMTEKDVETFDWNDVIHQDDLEALLDVVMDAMTERKRFSVEVRYRNAEGRYRTTLTQAQPRFDAEGQFLGMIGVNVDVTEARSEEMRRKALIDLAERFRHLDDPADMAYAAAEVLGRLLGVSRAGYGTVDLARETITIERDWNAPDIRTLAGVLKFRDYGSYIEDLKRGETVVVADATQDPRTAAGADGLKAISAQSFVNMPVTEREGLVALLYLNHEAPRAWSCDETAFIREVAEHTRAAVARREAERDLRQLADSLELQVSQRTTELDRVWRNSRDVLVILSEDGVLRSVNPAWTDVFGHMPKEVIGRSFRDFIWPDDTNLIGTALRRVGTTAFFIDQEIRFLHRDGTPRWISWRISAEAPLIFAYGRDITAEREQAQALVQAEEQLRQAQKMESIGQLTGGVAHDFNNLLQVISGNLQMLVKDVAGNTRAEQRINSALAGVGRGSKLANQLLAFGRRQPLEPKVINIGRFVAGMEEMLRRTLGEAIEIETIRSSGLWNTFVDPSQIENALLNLAINARDAMNGVGKLTIEVGNAFIDDNYISRHPDLMSGQYVQLAVTDTGTGMTPEVIKRAFEPFYSTKPVGKGSGLGLSMVYGFVKQSGGHVKIYSEAGEGTTIRLYLPRSQQSEDRLAELDFGPITGGTETILVAEDDEEVRLTVVEMLGDLGYSVLKARDAASALTVIESGMSIDLLFTDVVMPGPLRSAELARKAKERLPDIAVLFTSGYTENSIVHDGKLDAGIDLLSKPYSREALARKIRQVLNSRPQPLKSEAMPKQASLAPQSEMPVNTPKDVLSILLVEDDFLIRMNSADILQELGHTIREAGSGEEAWSAIQREEFDVLLTDLGLPGMSGAMLAEKTRGLRPDIGIVFATGHNEIPPVPGSRPAILLRKPFDTNDVVSALTNALK